MLKRFQLVVHPNNQVDLRLEPITSISKEEAYMVAKNTLLDFFKQYGELLIFRLNFVFRPNCNKLRPVFLSGLSALLLPN